MSDQETNERDQEANKLLGAIAEDFAFAASIGVCGAVLMRATGFTTGSVICDWAAASAATLLVQNICDIARNGFAPKTPNQSADLG